MLAPLMHTESQTRTSKYVRCNDVIGPYRVATQIPGTVIKVTAADQLIHLSIKRFNRMYQSTYAIEGAESIMK